MQSACQRLVPVALAAALLCLAIGMPAGATAKQKPISGTLDTSGYTVIALAKDGRAKTKRAAKGKFELRPPAKTATLHLRAKNGTYAGPIVLAKKKEGKRAIVGVRAGAKLGKVTLKPGKGFAKVADRPPDEYVDTERWGRAEKGVPIGAGNFGLVKSKNTEGGVPGDRDLDGIPGVLDIDDDGDRILDGYDRPKKVRPSRHLARAASFPDGSNLHLTTMFGWTPYGAVNANGGSTDEELAAAERIGGVLGVLWDGIDPGSGELDCGALIYCSAGGTGIWRETNQPPDPSDPRAGRPRFPECCDSDADGLGSLMPDQLVVGLGERAGGMFILHGAADEIRAEDIVIARGTLDGAAVQYPSSVGFVFSSDPVIAAYDDGQGNAATFSYPPAEACRPATVYSGVFGPCMSPMRAGPTGEVVLRLTVWRPQRPRLASEGGSGRWMDVGHLAYAIYVQARDGGGWCPQSSYTAMDPNLSPLAFDLNGIVPAGGALADTSDDRPAAPGNTFGFTLNLSRCYAAIGAAATQPDPVVQLWAWAIGSTYPVSGPAPDAHSQIGFRLEP